MGRRTSFSCLSSILLLALASGCRQPARHNGDSSTTPLSNAADNKHPIPAASTFLYATPAAPTSVTTHEAEPPDILTLRQNLKSRRLKPGEAPTIPPESVLDSSVDLSGVWTTGGGFSGWTLRLFRRSDSVFDVKLFFWDCTSREQTEGVGSYQDGVLTLDLSVMSHPAMGLHDFKTLHALRVGSFPVLARPSEAESLVEFETLCEAARVDLKDHLGLRPWPTFIREDDYK